MRINYRWIIFQKIIYGLKKTFRDVPLTFLIDDILRTMALNQKNYFKLNKENTKDGRDHYFWFEIETLNNHSTRRFSYIKSTLSNRIGHNLQFYEDNIV